MNLGQINAAIWTARSGRPIHELGGHGRGIPNKRDHHGANRRIIVGLEGHPVVRFVIIFTEEVNALRIRGAIVATTDNPGRGLGRAIAAPDTRPQGVADGLPIPTRLITVGPKVRLGGHASVRSGLLLQVREGEAEGDQCMELTLRPVLRGLR